MPMKVFWKILLSQQKFGMISEIFFETLDCLELFCS